MFEKLVSALKLESGVDFVMITTIAVLTTVLMVFVGYKLLQMLQLTGYKVSGYVSWFKETKYSYISRLFMLSFLSLSSMLITNVLLSEFFTVRVFYYVAILFFILFCSLFITNLFTAKQKTPLKYTKRMTRLVCVYSVIVFITSWAIEYVGLRFIPYLSYTLVGIVPIILPLIVFISYYITYPIEKLISNSYIKKSKKKLYSMNDLKVIGITGSYGKTTVKRILGTILSEKYKVCITPSSYNTPLGLAKTILSKLEKTDEIFIAEMGAKQRNDIKELCFMVKPSVGVITGIGNQHLLTFGSLEAITQTKAELAEYVTDNNGKLYINTDSEKAQKVAEKFNNSKQISLNSNKNEIFVENVKTTKTGSSFELCYNGERVNCKTILLGNHNISNILLASRVAVDLGLTLKEISAGISKLVTVPHRLEIIKSTSQYTIIDDAYNSSVEGSKASLDVLSKFTGKKIVITPGLVELGTEQFNANFQFGIDMAAVCSYVIIDSSINYDAISAGLSFAGFDENNIYQAGNLTQAVQIVNTLAESNDVVLFENDLPDNYS